MYDHEHDETPLYDEDFTIYCVRCRESVMVDDPHPVWTRKGLPATRATCPQCGGTVFRLGKTEAHRRMDKPAAVQVAGHTRAELNQEALYLNFAPDDRAVAQKIAADLERIGLACWLHEIAPPSVDWAGGVHPALTECAKMIVVLSHAAHLEPSMVSAWTYFVEKKKPIVIAQASEAPLPDALRRKPRYDFAADYKSAFRQLVQALSG